MSTHPDLPDTLVHFTGRPRSETEAVPEFAQGSAEERLISILHSGVLRGNPTFKTDAPVICFSEVTEEARRVMLRQGVRRGPYPPWGLVLHRERLIAAGARPVLYVSRAERDRMMQELPRRTYNRCVAYEPNPGSGWSDWLFEREWRLCFDPDADPDQASELAITRDLVAGVIVGRKGWMPPPRQSAVNAVSELNTRLKEIPALVKSLRASLPDGASVGSISVSSGSWTTKFAGAADRLARWYWDGENLVEDGSFDIRDQQMRHAAYDDPPAFEVGFSFDVRGGSEQ
ncbi:hypothetical protein ACFU6S_35230 [Streptomyces sp. NPDC057456]|uniref:hypothetical protein n=1 Tax=Streptomyces sp. NPDC057456 TaxID=3346139 RepID=UPI0036B059C5